MELNISNGIFPGLNDKEGIMLCGYEWGDPKNNEVGLRKTGVIEHSTDISKTDVAFTCKERYFGPIANEWPYDQKIKDWFRLWGHELNSLEAGNFEKTIVQTNWCNTQARNTNGNIFLMLLKPEQIDNFIYHVNKFKPYLLLFFGSVSIKCLQNERVLGRFIEIMGPITEPLKLVQKEFPGKKFNIGFQNFANCKVVSLPHPSGSHGITGAYISLFSPEIGPLIAEVKRRKGIVD